MTKCNATNRRNIVVEERYRYKLATSGAVMAIRLARLGASISFLLNFA